MFFPCEGHATSKFDSELVGQQMVCKESYENQPGCQENCEHCSSSNMSYFFKTHLGEVSHLTNIDFGWVAQPPTS